MPLSRSKPEVLVADRGAGRRQVTSSTSLSRWWQRSTAAKVPVIGVLFWIIKLLTTAAGEAIADYADHRVSPVLAGGVALLALGVVVAVQLSLDHFSLWWYWSAVLGVAIAGTMAADGLHVVVGLPYVATSALALLALGVIFAWWKQSEGTVSIHTITTARRELFYWATVGATFMLGTALGDLTAASMHLGYGASVLLFAALLVVPAVTYRIGVLGAVSGFWTAYVLTRPLGASIADYLSFEPSRGGLGYGTGPVSIALLVGFAVTVTLSSRIEHHQG